MEGYKHSRNCVGSNRKHVQITTKYRYKMMRTATVKTYCQVAIEEACKRHGIVVDIIKVMSDHVHMIVDVPRTMSDAQTVQIIKGLSSYLLFRICPNLRKRYPNGHFWNAGYFCDGVGNSDFARTWDYIENQELHHTSQ